MARTDRTLTTETPARHDIDPTYKKSAKFYNEDDEADLMILSCDEVLFKVPAYVLQAASPVFRDLIRSSRHSRIDLVDQDIETEAVFTGLLSQLTKGIHSDDFEVDDFERIIALAKKYQCEVLLQQYTFQGTALLAMEPDHADTVFFYGLALDSLDLCADALAAKQMLNDKHVDDSTFGNHLPNCQSLDPAGLALTEFVDVKPEIMWAWLRAYRVVYGLNAHEEEDRPNLNKAVAAEFKRLLSLKGAPESLS